ncbi:MAG: hypothetical protein ACYCZQ_03255 [Burkholderiales bacterium]
MDFSSLFSGGGDYGSLFSAGMQIMGGLAQSKAQKQQANAVQAQANVNAVLQDEQAKQLRIQAQRQADVIKSNAASVVGTQEAQTAASGAVIGDGSAGVMTDDTFKRAQSDALAALYSGNAQATQVGANADFTRMAGTNQANALRQQATASILNGVSSAFNSYSSYKMLQVKNKGSTATPSTVTPDYVDMTGFVKPFPFA